MPWVGIEPANSGISGWCLNYFRLLWCTSVYLGPPSIHQHYMLLCYSALVALRGHWRLLLPLPLSYPSTAKASDLFQTKFSLATCILNRTMEEWRKWLGSSTQAETSLQACLKLCGQVKLSVMVEMVCVWAVQYGSHQPHVATSNMTSKDQVLIIVHFNQFKFKLKQYTWSAAMVPNGLSLEFPAPTASHDLCFSHDVCFCCKTKETLLRSI